jgi:hypothetical protein
MYLVPSDVRLRLALDEFVVTEPGDGRTQRYRIERLTHSTVEGKWEEVAAQSELIGRDVGPPGQRSPAPIFGAFTTEGPLPGVFEVQLPKALVDDAAIDFPKGPVPASGGGLDIAIQLLISVRRVRAGTARSRTTRSTGRADTRRAGERGCYAY